MSAEEIYRIERKIDDILKLLKKEKDSSKQLQLFNRPETRLEVAALLHSIIQPENWQGNTWFAKRSLVQWAEDIVASELIQRGGPVDS